jgi:predicted solute-binding protein
MLKHKCNLQCDCLVCNCCVGYCDYLKEIISGPHKKARAKADVALANGDTAISYRGVSFTVVDHDRGWTYHIGNQELGSLEEVFNAIDATKKTKKTKKTT